VAFNCYFYQADKMKQAYIPITTDLSPDETANIWKAFSFCFHKQGFNLR